MTPSSADFLVRPLQPALGEAWLQFFDHVAFADNPRWASCYCQFPTIDHDTVRWADRGAAENRDRACQRIAQGREQGMLALDSASGAVVGWCHAGPWRATTIMDEAPEPLADRLGAITCFVVAPAWRGRGVATALLEGACQALRAAGCVAVDAWARPAAADPAALHTGPMSMYQAAGFVPLREADGAWLMRRALA